MHPPQLHLPTLPRRSSLAVELQRPIWGEGEGRNALAAACRPVQSPGLSCAHHKRRQREREKGGGSARAHSEPPYPVCGEASRPGPQRRREEHGGPNPWPFPEAPGENPESRDARRARSRTRPSASGCLRGSGEGARGLLGPSGRRLCRERGGARAARAVKGRAVLRSQP